jgi:hypothetical protein
MEKTASSHGGLGMGLTAFHCKKYKPVTKIHNEPSIWADLKIACEKNE